MTAQDNRCLRLQVSHNGRTITEVEVDDFLTGKRREQPGFVEPSFPTIAGSGPNGAIIHYRAQEGTCADVTSASLLLVDSGAGSEQSQEVDVVVQADLQC